jgi:hypothetical protein
MRALAFHPLANIFPLVEAQDFAELRRRLHEPIVVYEN